MILSEQSTFSHSSQYEAYISDLQQYIVAEYLSTTGELNWGRIICTWNEKKESDNIVTHTYAASVDATTGEIYVDDRPRVIFTKIFAHLLTRPFLTIIKTIYHLSLLPTFKEVGEAVITKQPASKKLKNISRSIADIVLTPLYGLALTISSVAILALSPFNNELLYDGRKFLGKLEDQSNWDEKSEWTLAPCFHGKAIEIFKNFENADFDDTAYHDITSVDHALTNFARAQIHHKIKHFDIFSCYSQSDQAYTSYLPA